jgi:hypothetical protein
MSKERGVNNILPGDTVLIRTVLIVTRACKPMSWSTPSLQGARQPPDPSDRHPADTDDARCGFSMEAQNHPSEAFFRRMGADVREIITSPPGSEPSQGRRRVPPGAY